MRLLWPCIISTAAYGIMPALSQNATSSASDAALQQMVEALPKCALGCLVTLISQSGCSFTDLACICTNTELNEQAALCLATNCTIEESLVTEHYRKTMCGAPVRDQSSLARKVSFPLLGIAILCVAFRFLVRSPTLEGPGYGFDDWTILLALALLISGDSLLGIMTYVGLGRDIWTLKPREITNILYLFWTIEFIYTAIMSMTKISILLLYLRIFPSTISTRFRRACYIMIALCVTYCISMWLAILFNCAPIPLVWTRWDGAHTGDGHCININSLAFANSGINILYDFCVIFLPIPKLMRLELSTHKKIGVCLTFMVGLFTTICGIIRLQYLVRWGDSANPTWDYNLIAVWSGVEGATSVICACMPSLAGPTKKIWKKAFKKVSKLGSRNHEVLEVCDRRYPIDLELAGRHGTPSKNNKSTLRVSSLYGGQAPSTKSDEVDLMQRIPAEDSQHDYTRG